MCQSKAAGGKRCFAHHPGTKASISYVHAKTGIDKEQIYAIMKELRKEGRNLEAPTPEELEKFFQKEEFMTRWDNTLSEKEKVAILRQILAARLEADQNGVQGGVFHSWKNALKRTVDKFKRPLIAIGLSSALVFSAAGCAGNQDTAPEPTKSPTEIAAICEVPADTDLGDLKPREVVEDEYGSYCAMTIADGAREGYMSYDQVDQSVKDLGFTEQDVIEAQNATYKFVAEQAVDSTRLDNYSTPYGQWIESSNLVDPARVAEYKKIADEGNDPGLIITNSLPAPLTRTGQPRGTNFDIKTTRVVAEEYDGVKYIVVSAGYSINYTAKKSEIVNLIKTNHPEMSEETIRNENPMLFEGDGDVSQVTVVADQNLAYNQNEYNQLAGTGLTYTVFAGSIKASGD